MPVVMRKATVINPKQLEADMRLLKEWKNGKIDHTVLAAVIDVKRRAVEAEHYERADEAKKAEVQIYNILISPPKIEVRP